MRLMRVLRMDGKLDCWSAVGEEIQDSRLSQYAVFSSSHQLLLNLESFADFKKDGIFSNPNMMSSDIPATLPDEAGGTLWDNLDAWERFSPHRHTMNWTQPMLFIHSDNDFRCPITEGLAAYTVCQQRHIPSRFLNFPGT